MSSLSHAHAAELTRLTCMFTIAFSLTLEHGRACVQLCEELKTSRYLSVSIRVMESVHPSVSVLHWRDLEIGHPIDLLFP